MTCFRRIKEGIICTMGKNFIFILLVGVMVLLPSFAFANSTADLKVQIEELLRQALVIREQIKQMAFGQPVQATSTVTGQKTGGFAGGALENGKCTMGASGT